MSNSSINASNTTTTTTTDTTNNNINNNTHQLIANTSEKRQNSLSNSYNSCNGDDNDNNINSNNNIIINKTKNDIHFLDSTLESLLEVFGIETCEKAFQRVITSWLLRNNNNKKNNKKMLQPTIATTTTTTTTTTRNNDNNNNHNDNHHDNQNSILSDSKSNSNSDTNLAVNVDDDNDDDDDDDDEKKENHYNKTNGENSNPSIPKSSTNTTASTSASTSSSTNTTSSKSTSTSKTSTIPIPTFQLQDSIVLETTFDSILLTDAYGILLKVNQRAVEEFGYDNELELIGKNVSVLVGGQGGESSKHDAYINAFHKRGATSAFLGKLRYVMAKRKDGTEFPCQIGLKAISTNTTNTTNTNSTTDNDIDTKNDHNNNNNNNNSVLMIAYIRDMTKEVQRMELEVEKIAAEKLLLNILPGQVANRLKDDPSNTFADRHTDATVLFADIVGFTAMAGTMTPEALVDLLNDIFSRFDEALGRYDGGLNKIKTIGDCYMVTSIPTCSSKSTTTTTSTSTSTPKSSYSSTDTADTTDGGSTATSAGKNDNNHSSRSNKNYNHDKQGKHENQHNNNDNDNDIDDDYNDDTKCKYDASKACAAICHFAMDLIEIIDDYSQHHPDRPLNIRIGINTGPIVAGIIGTKRFMYDIWGPAVNIASRMESTGIPGKIQVTKQVVDLVPSSFLILSTSSSSVSPSSEGGGNGNDCTTTATNNNNNNVDNINNNNNNNEKEFTFQHRGIVHAKGVGDIDTYFLISRQRKTARNYRSSKGGRYWQEIRECMESNTGWRRLFLRRGAAVIEQRQPRRRPSQQQRRSLSSQSQSSQHRTSQTQTQAQQYFGNYFFGTENIDFDYDDDDDYSDNDDNNDDHNNTNDDHSNNDDHNNDNNDNNN